MLRRVSSGPPPCSGLLGLTLRSVVAAVHALHASSPGPVPLRMLLDGYFRVLNADPTAVSPEAARGLISLRVQMLGKLGFGEQGGVRVGAEPCSQLCPL